MLIGADSREHMTEAQAAAYDAIASGPRGGVPSPFLAMLDAPGLALALQEVGATIRFAGNLSDAMREIAILATAGAIGSGYEWGYHLPIARRQGVADAVIEATIAGRSLEDLDDVSLAIIRLCRVAVRDNVIDAAALEVLVGRIGRPAASEVVAIAGYYQVLALFLSAAKLDKPVPSSAPAASQG